MKRIKPLAIAGAAMFALAACGGGGGSSDDDQAQGEFQEADDGSDAKDPERQAPAADIEGATPGGTITVYLPGDPGPDSMDPTEGWSVTGNSIQQALTSRSLTQYARDDNGRMVLVPDLATDLGTPNEDFTQWQFTIRDDAKWENGETITPQEVAFGIARSMDSDTFPAGAGTEYSQTYFQGAGAYGDEPPADGYKGPYTGNDPDGTKWGGVTVDGQTVTINMAKSFPDMDYWGAFMAMGPAPLGDASQPPNYGKKILSNGPYKVESFRPTEELVLVKNDQWDPNSDPGRHQYADGYVFKFNADQAQTDQIMLSDNAESQTAISASLGSENYTAGQEALGDRLVQQSAQCTSFIAPDFAKIDDINVRKALAYAYPYTDMWQATGEVPGVTRVPANSVMPPGMTGKKDYFVDGEQFTYDPEKSLELLGEAGYSADNPYPITMIYYETDALAVAGQRVYEQGMADAGFAVTGIPVQESPYNTWLNPDDATNQSLNLRGVNWCSDWPSGLTMLPPLLKTGAAYNTAQYSNPETDARMDEIPGLPLEEQADAWGDLDEKIATEEFPVIPTAFRNDLFVFGSSIGNPTGDGALGAPNYKDLYVAQ
jgi:peptide/nickel transport system substrate-binding protein